MNRLRQQPAPTHTDRYRTIRHSVHHARTSRTPETRPRHSHPAPPRPTPAEEVNERYPQHPATGSFAVDTEGEITRGTSSPRTAPGSCGTRTAWTRGAWITAGACARRAAIRWPHHGVVSGTPRWWGTSAMARQRGARPVRGRPGPRTPPHTGGAHRRTEGDGRNPSHPDGTDPRRVTGAPRATDAPSRHHRHRPNDRRAEPGPASNRPRPGLDPASTRRRADVDRAATRIRDAPRVHTGDRAVPRVPTGGRP